MPTSRCGHVRFLLKTGQAVVVRLCPFTIKLTYQSTEIVQPLTLGIDVGSRHIGLSVTSSTKEVYAAKCEIRDDISKYVRARKVFRQVRRNRKCRYRKRRFLNRKRKPKWLTPTIKDKIQSHIRMVRFIIRLLPIMKIRYEIAKFDIIKILGFSHGLEKTENYIGDDYEQIRAYVLYRDKYICQNCYGKSGDKILRVHHIIRRRDGGTNRPENLVTLCHTCHQNYHNARIKLRPEIKAGLRMRDATAMNIIKEHIGESLKKECPLGIIIEETYGATTKAIRNRNGIPKTHINDAFCIAGNLQAKREDRMFLHSCQRRHNRRLHKQTIISPHRYKGIKKLSEKEKKRGYRAPFQTAYEVQGIRLHDKVLYRGRIGFISSRTGLGRYRIREIDRKLIGHDLKRDAFRLIEHNKGILTVVKGLKD